MLVVETIAKIRRAYFVQNRPIKTICCEFRVSRKVVRKVIRSRATEFRYERGRQPLPQPLMGNGNSVVSDVVLTKINLPTPHGERERVYSSCGKPLTTSFQP